MGWSIDREGLHEHEGYAAFVDRRGRLSGSLSSEGVFIRRPDAEERTRAAWAAGRTPKTEDVDELVPWDDVIGWQSACSCGWTGQRWDRSSTLPGEYDGRHAADAYLADGETVEAKALEAWTAHVEPLNRLGGVREAAGELERARQRLDDAVHEARAAGSSWADVGRAAGMTRQSAHERWGRGTPVTS